MPGAGGGPARAPNGTDSCGWRSGPSTPKAGSATAARGSTARRYRCTTHADARHPPAPHLLQRRFAVAGPDPVWVSDVTACWTRAGWLYLAVILDLRSRRLVGWATSAAADQALTRQALQRALTHRRPAALHHSDRGAHYTAAAYGAPLAAHGITASMRRTGNCWDNAVAESVFATLKTELVAESRWASHRDATAALAEYLSWYNRQRLHSSLGYVSPIAFESRFTAA